MYDISRLRAKVKVKLFLCLISTLQHYEEILGGEEVWVHAFMMSALCKNE
jgi:hypothetical protein